MSEQPEQIDPIGLFPPEMQAGVQDLTFLGYTRRQVDFCGHVFVLETIRPYLKHAISLVLEPYRNTIYQDKVWAATHVGVALASINGDTAFCPPTQDSPTGFVEARFRWLTGPQGYWDPTIDYLMGVYTEMELEVQQTVAELHRLSERSRGISQPSPGSLIAPGPSGEPTSGDTPPTVPSK